MKQISQNKKTGLIKVANVSSPGMHPGMILVKNYFSIISAGTEKTTIDSRKASILERARSQPDEVIKVIEEVKRTGLLTTYKRIMSKLDASASLGYSSSGIVLAVDESVHDIEVGDRVACAGAEYAYHADIIAVPRNLLVKIPDGVAMETAAYSTLGAIALQGIRQANPTLGELVVVIGLGLLGQLTVQMLKANGCKVIGIDLDPFAIDMANNSGADFVLHRERHCVESIVDSASKGYGADAVIITAGTKSNDPIELAGTIARERGRIIVVGAATMEIPRSSYYRKEIDIRLSRSYGPGRYNTNYESGGLDFPIGYVRWTENRNMQAFLDLVNANKINTRYLTTHRYSIDEALAAYALIEGEKSEPYLGIMLTYDDISETEMRDITGTGQQREIHVSEKRSSLTVGFIGAGNFASGYLLPHLKALNDVTLATVCNRTGLTASDMRNKFGFAQSTTNPEAIFTSETIGTVFIATRHGEHGSFVHQALMNGQHVFVEKPLATSESDLDEIEKTLSTNQDARGKVLLFVGYNRRFAPLITEMKTFFHNLLEPSIIHYYVNAGFLPKDHWTHDLVEGGGRIVGEICHFIDTIQFLTDASPLYVSAETMATNNEAVVPHDNVNITMRMSDGSLGIITYASNGDTALPKERIVMSSGNATAIMDNFSVLRMSRGGKSFLKKSPGDKGHKHEVYSFIDAIRHHRSEVIPYASLITTTRTTFRILDSLRLKERMEIHPSTIQD